MQTSHLNTSGVGAETTTPARSEQPMCVAMVRISESEPYQMVTLNGELFMANRGLIESCIEKSKVKHPDWQFVVREVLHG